MTRLADVLRAEALGKDLIQEDGAHGRIVIVCAMREDGSLYRLGHVTEALVYQSPQMAWRAIDKIKFAKAVRR